jgi:hypothetical protein
VKRELLPGQEEQSISRIASVAVVVACVSVYSVYLLHEERGGGQKLQVGVLENFQIIITSGVTVRAERGTRLSTQVHRNHDL